MIQARAIVERLEGDQVWVRVSEQAGGCGRCHEPGGCRSVKIAHLFKPPTESFCLPNSIGARPGDPVLISIDDGAPLRAALASYALSAVLMVVGGAIGALACSTADLAVLAGALAGLLLAWACNRLLLRSRRWRNGLRMAVAPACGHAVDEGR